MPFPVGDADIASAEESLGASLPPSFRTRIAADNGGSIAVRTDEFELFKILDRSDRKRMARTAANDIVRENVAARSWTGFPEDCVAIGTNNAGDYLVLLRVGASLGPAVYVWDHETGGMAEVASDFGDLLRPN